MDVDADVSVVSDVDAKVGVDSGVDAVETTGALVARSATVVSMAMVGVDAEVEVDVEGAGWDVDA